MGIKLFIRDNINALSFNMLIITALDIISFLVMFVLVLPLPDTLRRGYAGFISQATVPFAFFMMFCMYNMFSTVFKLLRSINDYHSGPMTTKKVEPRAFYKRIAKNQRDILLCIMGCIFSLVSLLLSVQMKNMTTDPKKEEEEVEKDPVAKKEDYICLLKQLVYILYRGQKFFCCFVDIIPTAAQCKFTLHSRESQILCFNQYQINYHQISDICRIEDLNIHTIHRSHRSHRIHKMGRRYPSCKEGSGTITTTIT